MASTATSRLRAQKQGTGDNENSWGATQNAGAFDLFDEAWGVAAVTVSGNVTLTSNNYASDQSRRFVIVLSGAGGFTVTHPAVDKPYFIINNCTAAVTMKPSGGSGASIRAGAAGVYYTDAAGTTGHFDDPTLDKIKAPVASVNFSNQRGINVLAPSGPGDIANKQYVDDSVEAVSDAADAAEASAAAAAASAASAEADVEAFNALYLGSQASDPTVDGNGDPVAAGCFYFNTVSLAVKFYNGSAWSTPSAVTLSSQAEAEAGSDNTTVMTPLRVAQAIDAQVPQVGLVPVGTPTTISGTPSQVDIALSGSRAEHHIYLHSWRPTTDAVAMWLRTSTDSGATFDSGASDYQYAATKVVAGGSVTQVTSTGAAQIVLTDSNGNATQERLSCLIKVIRPHVAQNCVIEWTLTGTDPSGNLTRFSGGGVRLSAADVTHIRLLFSASSTIAGGQYRQYYLADGT